MDAAMFGGRLDACTDVHAKDGEMRFGKQETVLAKRGFSWSAAVLVRLGCRSVDSEEGDAIESRLDYMSKKEEKVALKWSLNRTAGLVYPVRRRGGLVRAMR